MKKLPLIFAGSFQHYSTYIAKALADHPSIDLQAIITTPPRPAGRKKILQKTHTHLWAKDQQLPVFAPENLFAHDPRTLFKSFLLPSGKLPCLLTAGYGKLIPSTWLRSFTYALNLHFSLLPKFRGANPAEWAILLDEEATGITLIEMDEEFDTGNIIATSSTPIQPNDNRETLYESLYKLGSETITAMLTSVIDWHADHPHTPAPSIPQPASSPTPPALRFTRAHGFIDWQIIKSCQAGLDFDINLLNSQLRAAAKFLNLDLLGPPATTRFIERSIRALYGYPGVWTYIPTKKGKQRLKIHSASISNQRLILDQVQLEGKGKSTFNQIKSAIIGA